MNTRCFRLLNLYRNLRPNNRCTSTSSFLLIKERIGIKEIKTDKNLNYFGDPDLFGTLTRKTAENDVKDEDDIREETFIQNLPLPSQKLTIRQYADLIKQYVKLKRLKEAMDVLEIRMLKEDRVKPDNYIYNILIGACADSGYTRKAFKLYNDMKKRALKPTGDTYTCLFEACINSPWPKYGLKQATNLRNLMIEKGIEPNLTNYNVMIKAFGRCSDLTTAFKIVDEMISKKIKIRVQTFNHLLQACISDKESGLQHALLVWRKMLDKREKPNIYSFNLMLKCVKDCNLSSNADILQILENSNTHLPVKSQTLYLEDTSSLNNNDMIHNNECNNNSMTTSSNVAELNGDSKNITDIINNDELQNNKNVIARIEPVQLQVINKDKVPNQRAQRTVPNLLSRVINANEVLSCREVSAPQDKFTLIGGQDDFLKEMECYSVKPNIKTFTQMLPLLDNNSDAENKLLKSMESLNIKPDIDFYNMLMKKRCLRSDYDAALEVKEIIVKDSKSKKRHPMSKKNKLKFNIMTYGVLAMTCKTRSKAQELINEMKDKQLKMNIEILGAMLQNATHDMQFGYVLFVMSLAKQENLRVNNTFLKHLEVFNEKCLKIIEKNEQEDRECPVLKAAHQRFYNIYINWLSEVDAEEVLKEEHPWEQFKERHPETLQRENINIRQPKRFYKRSRKFVKYVP